MKIAFLSLIVAVGVAIAGWYQLELFQHQLIQTQASVEKVSQEVTPKVTLLEQEVHKIENKTNQVLQKPMDQNFILDEVSHLLFLAQLQLEMARDKNTAISLLTLAETKLQTENDPRFIPLREAIMADKKTLQLTPLPNIQAIWLQVSTLLDITHNLPVRGLKITLAPDPTLKENARDTTWRDTLKHSLKEIKDLVKIQKHTAPIDPLPSQTEQLLAEERLRLLLEELRFAILSQEEIVYQRTIQDIQQWLEKYFEKTDKRVQHISETLTELAAISLSPTLPTLAKSHQQLQALRQ